MAQAVVELGFDMQCAKPIRLFNVDRALYPEGLVVGCGKCKLCRKKRKSEWALRLIHEMRYHKNSSFCTFTYSDEYLPQNGSLKKEHIQNYFKRLRKAIEPKKIKHFTAGEYGDKYGRPHYHSIIFGESDRDIISDKWEFGFVDIGFVSIESIRYVSGYLDKKFDGELEKEVYTSRGKESVFKLQSKGFGLNYCIENMDRIMNDLRLTVKGTPVTIPRYYIKKIEEMSRIKFPESRLLEFKDNMRFNSIEKERYNNEKLLGHHATNDELKLLWKQKVIEDEAYFNMLDMQRMERGQKELNLSEKIKRKIRGKL